MNYTQRFPKVKFKYPVSILMPVCNEADVIEDVIMEWISDVIDFLPKGSELLFDDGYTVIELEASDTTKKYGI